MDDGPDDRSRPGDGSGEASDDASGDENVVRRVRGLGTLVDSEIGARIVRRPALTFKVRRRGLSPRRQAQFDEWIRRWNLEMEGPPVDWSEVFHASEGRGSRVVLDIGFGHGESTIQMAAARPDLDVVGVEVHDPGVVTVLDAIENTPLPNVRVMHGDVLAFLHRLGPETLHAVRIFFPDPWKKQRQHHRRLVRADVVTALVDRLVVGGELHLATDIADYAELMEEVCDAEERLDGGVIPRPDERPLTRFERRAIDASRGVTDLRYTRVR